MLPENNPKDYVIGGMPWRLERNGEDEKALIIHFDPSRGEATEWGYVLERLIDGLERKKRNFTFTPFTDRILLYPSAGRHGITFEDVDATLGRLQRLMPDKESLRSVVALRQREEEERSHRKKKGEPDSGPGRSLN